MAVGQTADHAIRLDVHSARPPPRTVESGEKKAGGEEPVQDPGLPCRWEMQPGGTRLPLRYGCEKVSSGWGRRREQGVRVGAPRTQGAGRGEESGDGGAGCQGGGTLFLPTPSFMASAGEW